MNKEKEPIFKSLGKKTPKFLGLETFQCPSHTTSVTCVSDEVTAMCPVTGQPDWYVVRITYRPKMKCVESKSLKLYLQSFRNAGHFCEKFAEIIASDLFKILLPHHISVTVIQKPRGGIAIESTSVVEDKNP